MQSEAWQAENENKIIPDLFRMLREVLVEVKDLGTIFIILDRVDMCGWKLHRIMDALVGLVLDDLWKVKIMIVHNPVGSDEKWEMEEMDEKALSRIMVHQEWHQRWLTPLELQRAHSAH